MKKIFGFIALAMLGMAGTTNAQNTNMCLGDSISFVCNIIGGTYQWQASTDGGVTYSNINGATTASVTVGPPSAGLYHIRAEVTTGCGPVYSDVKTVLVGALPVADAGTNYGGICTDVFTGVGGSPSGSGGTGSLTYVWTTTGTNHLSANNVANPDLNGIYNDQTYILTVTDSIGCSAADSFDVTELPFVTTYNFTGAMQTFTPNPCFDGDSILIQCWGGQGGSGATGGLGTAGGSGGLGGYAEGKVVSSNQTFNIFVGGQGATPTGGFNGGANGGSQNAGGGGGATDVRVGGTSEAERIITAGGGGGGGRAGCETSGAGVGGNGGSGGGGVGANGGDSPTSGGSAGGGKGGNFGAVQGAFGPAGTGCAGFLGVAGVTATNGTGGSGGNGQSCCCFTNGSIPGGGGGGGGQLGGGGGGGGSAGTTGCSGNDKGAGGGGGGGSSYTGGVINGQTNAGIWLGNGMVTITINP